MKRRVFKKRKARLLALYRWQRRLIMGHHYRRSLPSNRTLGIWQFWDDYNEDRLKRVDGTNKLTEKRRLRTLWNIKWWEL